MTDDKIVKFPDNRIVRQETAVSFEEMKRFLWYTEIAEQCGAVFNDFEEVIFPNVEFFELFCEKLLESK